MRFILVGFAAEFSLIRLAERLRQRALPVTAVDLAKQPLDPSLVPDGDGPLVLVSSQHLTMTRACLTRHASVSGTLSYRTPTALRELVSANVLVYVPHDLDTPVLPEEVEALAEFDLYCAPDENAWWANAHVPVVNVGWVGDFGDRSESDVSEGIWFVTQVNDLLARGGWDQLRKNYQSLIAAGLPAKLPDWPGLEGLAAGLSSEGLRLIDPAAGASPLIRATPLVVANATSSVLAEACRLGHRPMYVFGSEEGQRFAPADHLDVLICSDDQFSEARQQSGLVRSPARPFDIDGMLAAIEARVAALGSEGRS